MAHFSCTVPSRLPAADVFAYMASFDHARDWDPSVTQALRVGDEPLAVGVGFELVARFAGRSVPLRYTITEYDAPRRVVLEAQRPGFTSRDTITVTDDGHGSLVSYDAQLLFHRAGRLADPVLQRVFRHVGRRAQEGLTRALNP
jgi:hypothetical protein